MRLFGRVTALALAALVLAVPMVLAQSQATTGYIEGIVRDADGAVLPGATAVIKNTATDFERTVITDNGGRFRAPQLPLGPYTITVSLDGFATIVREGLDLAVGQTIALQFEMQVSAVGEAITVTGESPLIETSTTETQVRIDDKAIEGLPNNGRNFLDFNTLTPGVTIVQGPDGDEVSINGQKGINNNIMIDGADFNNPFFGEQRGGQRPPFTFNMDAIKEVLIVTEGAPAEFGRSSGGFVNVVTKSGTNKWQGTAHYFYRDDSLSDSPKLPDGGTEPDFSFNQQQYGFTVGGPAIRDKLFFFGAADIQDGEETKQTDSDRIAPDVVAFLDSVGLPNENGPIDRTDDANAYLAKLDWQINESNLLTGRWAYHYSEQINGTFDVDSWGVSANAIETDYSHSLTATALSTLSSNLLNEFRGQWAKEWRPRPYEGPIVPGQDRPFPDTAFDFGGGYRVGMPFFIPVEYDDDRLQLVDNVSWLKGAHSMKGGIEYNDVTSSQTFIGFANGRYIFDSFDGFQNYVANPNYVTCSDGSSSATGSCPTGTSATGPVLLYLQFAGVGGLTAEQAGTQDIEQQELALYFQDSWQPTANLTLDLGLRWEALYMPDPITPPSQVFFSDFIGQTVTTADGPQKFPSNGLIPDDTSQWQPRF
ncbi:MAG: TonB-dependent receptor, partial [Acidobacteriota bacterium]